MRRCSPGQSLANCSMLKLAVTFSARRTLRDESKATQPAQWMICVIRRVRVWIYSALIPQDGSIRSPGTTSTWSCQSLGRLEKHGEATTLSENLSEGVLPRAGRMSTRRWSKWTDPSPFSLKSSSRTTFPRNPVTPVTRIVTGNVLLSVDGGLVVAEAIVAMDSIVMGRRKVCQVSPKITMRMLGNRYKMGKERKKDSEGAC